MGRITTDRSRLFKGVVLMLLASLGFSSMSCCIKLAGNLPALQKVFFRNLISVGVVLLTLAKRHERISCKKENAFLMFMRCALGTVGIVGNYYAVDHMLLSNAAVLAKLSPFVTAIASWLLMSEKLRWPQLAAIAAAFFGSVLVTKPVSEAVGLLPVLSGLMAAFGAGTAYACVRMLLKRGENSNSIIFFFSAFSCLVCVPTMLVSYQPMTLYQTLCLLGAGCFASLGQFAMTNAYRFAASREISAVEYSQVIFAAIYGFVLFDQLPDVWSLLGYLVIFGALILNSWYSSQH